MPTVNFFQISLLIKGMLGKNHLFCHQQGKPALHHSLLARINKLSTIRWCTKSNISNI